MKLTIKNLSAGYSNREVLKNINVSFGTGEITCLLGPNGSGKTTFFKAILGILPSKGELYLDGRIIGSLSRKERARLIAYVPQMHIPPFPFTVFDVVLMGRTPYSGNFSAPSSRDKDEVHHALSLLGIYHLCNQNYAQLSGGERQLVLIARALAQSPRFLIMDEPTSHLDFGNQLKTIRLISRLARDKIGIILTTHVPDHAFMCAHNVIALSKGGIITYGKPNDVLTESIHQRMYNIDVSIISLPEGRCVCTPA